MPDGRLPKLVWQHNWQEGRRQGGQVKMWDENPHTREVAESVGMEELAAVCDAADSYGAYVGIVYIQEAGLHGCP